MKRSVPPKSNTEGVESNPKRAKSNTKRAKSSTLNLASTPTTKRTRSKPSSTVATPCTPRGQLPASPVLPASPASPKVKKFNLYKSPEQQKERHHNDTYGNPSSHGLDRAQILADLFTVDTTVRTDYAK